MNGDDVAEPGMHKDQITLPDGRYLIYYTFDDDNGDGDGDSGRGSDEHDDVVSDRRDEGARP